MLRLSRTLAGIYLLLAAAITAYTLLIAPMGWAPFQLDTVGPAGAPVTITIAYSTEKEQWLNEAVTRFEAEKPRVGGRPIQIELRGMGSREIVSEIVDNRYQPTVISPASMLQIEQLRSAWAARRGGQIIGDGGNAPQPLVITPMVLVAYAERAAVIDQAGTGDTFWENLNRALTTPNGWQDLGGQQGWGRVKFAHTSPETSNSGLQTLLLLAYGYYRNTGDLTIDQVRSGEFRDWLGGVEGAVPGQFIDSTNTLMTDMLRFGPSKYDFISVYENLAIESMPLAERQGHKLRVFYPPANIISDHPYAVLDAPWVGAAERAAATQFRDFLLSSEMQRLALNDYGFRPANPGIRIDPNDANSPFNRYAAAGIRLDIAEQVAVPSGDVIDTLVATWRSAANMTLR